MRLKAKTIFLLPEGDGKRTVFPGETVNADENTAQELISLGAAVEVAQSGKIWARPALAGENMSENQAEGGNGQSGPRNAENGVSREELEAMSFSQLKEMAKALGIADVGKIKSKAGMIEAILKNGEEIPEAAPDDEPPALDALDVIDE